MEEQEKPQEETLTFMERLTKEKKEMDERLAETNKVLAEMKELKAESIMSGKTDTGQVVEPKKELTDLEYTDKVMSGEWREDDKS